MCEVLAYIQSLESCTVQGTSILPRWNPILPNTVALWLSAKYQLCSLSKV